MPYLIWTQNTVLDFEHVRPPPEWMRYLIWMPMLVRFLVTVLLVAEHRENGEVVRMPVRQSHPVNTGQS